MTSLGAQFLPTRMSSPYQFHSPHPTTSFHLFFSAFTLHYYFLHNLRRLFIFFLYTFVSGHRPLSGTLPHSFFPDLCHRFFFFPSLSEFSVHCPPDSHPSTLVQFKKPFNSCHSTGLAISPAAKAQTASLSASNFERQVGSPQVKMD